MIEEHHNCSTGNGRTSGCCFDLVVDLTLFSSLCVIWSNYKHFNLPSSYEFRNLEFGDKRVKNKKPPNKIEINHFRLLQYCLCKSL